MGMPTIAKRQRLSEEWLPSADERDFGEANGADVDGEADSFRDYHLARGSLMADWSAAWRTWIRTSVRYGRATGQRRLPLFSVVPPSDDAYGARTWAGRLHDAKSDRMPDGTVAMCVGGYDAAATAVECCQAVGLPPDWRGSLDAIADWLRAGVGPDAIVEAIRSCAGRARKPDAWGYYAAKVMERRAA